MYFKIDKMLMKFIKIVKVNNLVLVIFLEQDSRFPDYGTHLS